MTNKSAEILQRYINRWLDDPRRHMWGVPFEQVTDREGLRDLPHILKILYRRSSSGQGTFCLQIDSTHFPDLYRGITGPDYLRRGRLGGASINTDVPDAARSPEMRVFIEEYAREERITGGHHGSRENGLYLTKNPLVALSADDSGPFATPRGILFAIRKEGLDLDETTKKGIDELTCKKVPLTNIQYAYVDEATAFSMEPICPDVRVNSTLNLRDYRLQTLYEIIERAVSNPTQRRYTSAEAQQRMLHGIDHFDEMSRRITPLIANIMDPSERPNAVYAIVGDSTNTYLLVPQLGQFKDDLRQYAAGMQEQMRRLGLPQSTALTELENLAQRESDLPNVDAFSGIPKRVITPNELNVYLGRNISKELEAAFFG